MSGRVSQKIFLRPVSGSGLLGLAHPTNWLRSHRRSRRSRAGTSTPPPSPSLSLSLSRTSVRRSWHILLVSPFIRWRFFRLPAPLSISEDLVVAFERFSPQMHTYSGDVGGLVRGRSTHFSRANLDPKSLVLWILSCINMEYKTLLGGLYLTLSKDKQRPSVVFVVSCALICLMGSGGAPGFLGSLSVLAAPESLVSCLAPSAVYVSLVLMSYL